MPLCDWIHQYWWIFNLNTRRTTDFWRTNILLDQWVKSCSAIGFLFPLNYVLNCFCLLGGEFLGIFKRRIWTGHTNLLILYKSCSPFLCWKKNLNSLFLFDYCQTIRGPRVKVSTAVIRGLLLNPMRHESHKGRDNIFHYTSCEFRRVLVFFKVWVQK